MLWAWLLGILVGILAAVRKNALLDHAITGISYAGFAFPPYVWGALFFLFVTRFISPLIVGAPIFAAAVRHTRVNVATLLNEQFITVARSKGISEQRILFKHALRNAINPLISIFGITLPTRLTGTILVGPVFGLPTFGRTLL